MYYIRTWPEVYSEFPQMSGINAMETCDPGIIYLGLGLGIRSRVRVRAKVTPDLIPNPNPKPR